jgi:hypothetical protein
MDRETIHTWIGLLFRLICGRLIDNATNMCIGYMAGWTVSHWADEILLGFSSGRSNAIGLQNLAETLYLYWALVAGQTQQ